MTARTYNGNGSGNSNGKNKTRTTVGWMKLYIPTHRVKLRWMGHPSDFVWFRKGNDNYNCNSNDNCNDNDNDNCCNDNCNNK